MTDTLKLTKHHGLGNDFLVVFHPPSTDKDVLAGLARRVCDRRRGIGADGLLTGETEADHAARMTVFNADGSRAAMSGNGIRCFAHALAIRRGDNLPVTMRILTDAGTRNVALTPTEDPATILAQVDMGAVTDIDPSTAWANSGGLDAHPDRPIAHLDLGNPHTVVGVDDVEAVDLSALGARVPDVNLEIIAPGPESNAVTMRVHERGAGLTEACGTGACAAAVAAARWGMVPQSAREIVVHMPGGGARVTLDHPAPGRVTLTGPATHVATIETPLQ
jgi:diaminopimelate epimerase